MDVSSLLSSLNLNNTTSNLFNFAAKIKGSPTEFVIGTFANQNFLLVTQFEKVGTVYAISSNQGENGFRFAEPVYQVNQLLGRENIYSEAAAKFIVKELSIRKPLMLFLDLKNYERDTVLSVIDAIKNYSKA